MHIIRMKLPPFNIEPKKKDIRGQVQWRDIFHGQRETVFLLQHLFTLHGGSTLKSLTYMTLPPPTTKDNT